MGMFSSEQSYLGVDFDNNSVKIVELKNANGRPQLVTYGYYDRKLDLPKIEEIDIDQTAKLIKEVTKKAKTSSNKVVTALPAYSVFSSILNLPNMSKKDLSSAVKWEAKKVVPMPIEEMILDWKVIEDETVNGAVGGNNSNSKKPTQLAKFEKRKKLKIKPGQTKNVKVLLTAAPKDLVKRYLEVFKRAGLVLLSLDTEPFALIRSLVGNDKSAMMIIDIGSLVTNIFIVSNGVTILNRSLDVGGRSITEAISSNLNISLERAEQFKYDVGLSSPKQGEGSVPEIIQTAISPILDELTYSLNIYKSQGQTPIEKVVLTGGSSLLLSLPSYISDKIDLKVYRGDPWARIIYPQDLKPVLDEIGSRFSVAAGLAMRNIG